MTDEVARRLAWFWYGAGVFVIVQVVLVAEPSFWAGGLCILTGSAIEWVFGKDDDDEDGDLGA